LNTEILKKKRKRGGNGRKKKKKKNKNIKSTLKGGETTVSRFSLTEFLNGLG